MFGRSSKTLASQRAQYYFRVIGFVSKWIKSNYDNIPRRVHVLGHEELFDVVDIIISDIKGRPFEGVEWLTRLPITGEVVLSLIDKSGNSLIDVLSYIGDSRIRRARPIKALPAPTIRRMLKVVRTSFSKTVLTGCWIVLSNSKFIKLAGIDLVIKLMQYTNKPEMIANIFNIPPRSESSWDQAELDTLIQVAERISKDFDQFDSAIVTSAGAFLAEHYKVNMRPLTHDEEVLSIKVREL